MKTIWFRYNIHFSYTQLDQVDAHQMNRRIRGLCKKIRFRDNRV